MLIVSLPSSTRNTDLLLIIIMITIIMILHDPKIIKRTFIGRMCIRPWYCRANGILLEHSPQGNLVIVTTHINSCQRKSISRFTVTSSLPNGVVTEQVLIGVTTQVGPSIPKTKIFVPSCQSFGWVWNINCNNIKKVIESDLLPTHNKKSHNLLDDLEWMNYTPRQRCLLCFLRSVKAFPDSLQRNYWQIICRSSLQNSWTVIQTLSKPI